MGRRTGLEPAGRLRLPRRPTMLRAAAICALLLTALAAAAAGLDQPLPADGAASDRAPEAADGGAGAHATAGGSGTSAPSGASGDGRPASGAADGAPTGHGGTARLPVPGGLVAVPVPFAAPATLSMVRAGDHVDLFTVPAGADPVVLAEHVPVLGVDRADAALLLALDDERARRVVAGTDPFAVVIRSTDPRSR